MFNLPRKPLCHRAPGVEGPGPIPINYEQTPKEAEAPVGTHRGREIRSADATRYLAEQESVVTGADSSSPIKAEATPVPAHHTTGLKENKLDSQDAKLLQERADLLQQAESLLGSINEQKVVDISLEVLEKALANGPEQVLLMLKSMEFPVGLNVKITLKSQPDKPLSLIPPGDELKSQEKLGALMDKTIKILKRHHHQYANTEVRASKAEKIRQFLITNDNDVAGTDTRGQGEGAQAFDKLRNRRCAITVHHRTPVEKSHVEARHHDASPVAHSAAEESSAITAREDSSGIESDDGYTDQKDLTTTTSSGVQKQDAPIATDPPMDSPTPSATPAYPVPLPLVNSSQTVAPSQPKEAEPAWPQSKQQATDSVEETSPFIPETEPASTPATENAESVPTEEELAVTETISALKEQTDALPDSEESLQQTVPIDSHSPLPETIPAPPLPQEEIQKTEGQAVSGDKSPDTRLSDLLDLVERVKTTEEPPNQSLPPTKSNKPIGGNSTQTRGRLSPNHDTANTPEAPRRLMEELSEKLANRKPITPEEVDEMDSNVARKWAQTAESVENDNLPFADELIKTVAAKSRPSLEKIEADIAKHKELNIHKDTEKPLIKPQPLTSSSEPGYDNPTIPASPEVAMEETAQSYKSVLSSIGYQPSETTVSFPPFPASDELPATAEPEQISPTQTDSKATDDIAAPKDETNNTSSSNKTSSNKTSSNKTSSNKTSSNKTFNDAKFKEDLAEAVAKMMRRSSNTIDADNITDSSGLSDRLPEDLTADVNTIMAALSPEESGEPDEKAQPSSPVPPAPGEHQTAKATPSNTQPTLNSDATTPSPPPTPPTPPPISQEILLSTKTRKAPASTSTAQANSPDNAKKTESGNGTKSKPSNQGFFGGNIFKKDLDKGFIAMDKKRQSANMDIDQKIAEAKAKAKAKAKAEEKMENEPNNLLGALKKRMLVIKQANLPDEDENDDF